VLLYKEVDTTVMPASLTHNTVYI